MQAAGPVRAGELKTIKIGLLSRSFQENVYCANDFLEWTGFLKAKQNGCYLGWKETE